MLEVVCTGLFHRLVGTVLLDAVLQMLRNTVTGDKRYVRLLEFELRISKQTSGRHLDDPDPELLAAYARTVKIHQYRLDRLLHPDRMYRVVRRVVHRRRHVSQRLIRKPDKLHLAVAGRRYRLDATNANAEHPVRRTGKRYKTFSFVNLSQVRYINHCFHPLVRHMSYLNDSIRTDRHIQLLYINSRYPSRQGGCTYFVRFSSIQFTSSMYSYSYYL